MTTLLLRCRVADFDDWKPQFEAVSPSRMLSYRMWRGVDDPNIVVLMETYESREAADAVLSDPALQGELVEHGVDVSSVTYDFLDEVVSSSR